MTRRKGKTLTIQTIVETHLHTLRPDNSHLLALMTGRTNERERLANAKTSQEIALRTVWVKQYDKQIADEAFLGFSPMPEISDEELMRELGIE